jgi:hypothetical protein
MGLGSGGRLVWLIAVLERPQPVRILSGALCLQVLERNASIDIVGDERGIQSLSIVRWRATKPLCQTDGLLPEELARSPEPVSCRGHSFHFSFLRRQGVHCIGSFGKRATGGVGGSGRGDGSRERDFCQVGGGQGRTVRVRGDSIGRCRCLVTVSRLNGVIDRVEAHSM